MVAATEYIQPPPLKSRRRAVLYKNFIFNNLQCISIQLIIYIKHVVLLNNVNLNCETFI
jgi:hypothetical protein